MICCSPNSTFDDLNCYKLKSNLYEVDITHFELHHLLGGGGFGIVQHATKRTGIDKNKSYAIKSTSKSSVLKRKTGLQSIYAELKILTLLNHPFICNIHYAFQDRSYLFLVLDLSKGGDLRYNLSLSGGKFTEERAKFYICQLILAIEYCHKLRIIHRDIKPENILLNDDGYIKLTDFGISKFLSSHDDCRSTSGTHGYMAPEMYVTPINSHGTPVDWFALGITLHEFVTGMRPFETKRIRSCQHNPANLPLKYLDSPSISMPLKIFISRLLFTLPFRRLKGGRGVGCVKSQDWLYDVNWTQLSLRSIKPPYIPSQAHQLHSVLTHDEVIEYMTRHLAADCVLSLSQQEKFLKYSYRNIIIPRNSSLSFRLERYPDEEDTPPISQSQPLPVIEDVEETLTSNHIIFSRSATFFHIDHINQINQKDCIIKSNENEQPLPSNVIENQEVSTSNPISSPDSNLNSQIHQNVINEPIKENSISFFSALTNPVHCSLWEIGKRVFRGELGNTQQQQQQQQQSSSSYSVVQFDVNSSENMNQVG